ncbi:hypothetical protein BDK51DRAFT_35061 [Blyttiomyces helicus]|uniref:ARID domain-containing protein n=1 Tax=Blyttiomyces helicus TaxID=388810 RepID=A0A4P9WLU4_9FUNG|nr:hypothetical protein BDK51DRAFT_35061 [Blyttiomyces helicus]|eukprot:RKO92110.1 hypothetical protein BDK51DRAFT_35061 [Blyttiomyces helicus]
MQTVKCKPISLFPCTCSDTHRPPASIHPSLLEPIADDLSDGYSDEHYASASPPPPPHRLRHAPFHVDGGGASRNREKVVAGTRPAGRVGSGAGNGTSSSSSNMIAGPVWVAPWGVVQRDGRVVPGVAMGIGAGSGVGGRASGAAAAGPGCARTLFPDDPTPVSHVKPVGPLEPAPPTPTSAVRASACHLVTRYLDRGAAQAARRAHNTNTTTTTSNHPYHYHPYATASGPHPASSYEPDMSAVQTQVRPMDTTVEAYGFTTPSSRQLTAEEFDLLVREFNAKARCPILKAMPILDKRTLSLWALYHAVLEFGGSEQVTRSRKWKKVAQLLGLPDSLTSASYTLRRYYTQFLASFEDARKAGDEDASYVGFLQRRQRLHAETVKTEFGGQDEERATVAQWAVEEEPPVVRVGPRGREGVNGSNNRSNNNNTSNHYHPYARPSHRALSSEVASLSPRAGMKGGGGRAAGGKAGPGFQLLVNPNGTATIGGGVYGQGRRKGWGVVDGFRCCRSGPTIWATSLGDVSETTAARPATVYYRFLVEGPSIASADNYGQCY